MEGDRERQPQPHERERDTTGSAAEPSSETGFGDVEEGLKLLAAIEAQVRVLQEKRFAAVRDLRLAGATWPQIAKALGERTRTVYQRWARRV